jgi:hypothetical protein
VVDVAHIHLGVVTVGGIAVDVGEGIHPTNRVSRQRWSSDWML